jgi:hypothetical protein
MVHRLLLLLLSVSFTGFFNYLFAQYEQNHSNEEVEHFISKLRVYSISDQDDCKFFWLRKDLYSLHSIHPASSWLRRRHPEIFWILSYHAMNVYVTRLPSESVYIC